MQARNRFKAAKAAYERGAYNDALHILSDLAGQSPDGDLLFLLGKTLAGMGMQVQAAEMFVEAAAVMGQDAPRALRMAADLYFRCGQLEQAQLIGLRLLQVTPDDPLIAFILISIFERTGETHFIDGLKNRLVKSDDPEHLMKALKLISTEALNANNLELFSKLRRHFPDDPFIRLCHLDFARSFCDLKVVEREELALRKLFARGDFSLLAAEEPHFGLMWLETDAEIRRASNVSGFEPYTQESRARRRSMQHQWSDRLRIGYLSADFWDDHATMRLLADVLRQHDRARFDITLYCNTLPRNVGYDTGGRAEWGRLKSIRHLSDEDALSMIREDGIDILVDLKGHTAESRSGIVNGQCAPITVAWLGFPGSAIGIDCDYIIGDRFVTPDEAAPDFHEIFCRLPDSYQPNDPVARPRPRADSRSAHGLPDDVFLFASFNTARKLTPKTLDLWSRVLKRAPKAHLWIMGPEAELKSAFLRRGISPNRLHFANKAPYDRHMDRTPLADLGLDTFPCNGHTTTSDMLWAGLPVVTRKGQSFSGRVSESLLNAIGLGDLVAEDDAAFVELAARIANNPDEGRALKARLDDNRKTYPLFNAALLCRHLEKAYEMMADRARKGLEPAPIDVPRLEH